MVPVAPDVPLVPVPIEPVPVVPVVPVLPELPLVPIEPLELDEPLVPEEPLVELRVSGSLERPVLVRPASTPELPEPLQLEPEAPLWPEPLMLPDEPLWVSFMLPELLVPIAPLLPDEPLVLPVLLEPLWPPIGLPVSPALLVPVLPWSAPFLLRLCFDESVVAPADELPLLWSFMLLLPLVPAPRVFWVPSDDCACTVVAPNMAAATEAPSRPFSSLFSFMVVLLNLSSGLKCSTISIRY
jgi:signal-induced proliferation-associated 1 like protein 3